MKFNVRGDNLVITKAIKEYVYEKISKLNKYFNNPEEIQAHIIMKVKGRDQRIEVTIPIKNLTLRAEESNNDLYAAIDLVSEKLERQILKNKTKIMSRIQKDNSKIMDFEVETQEEPRIKISKKKMIHMKPMDIEEAVLQMELVDHPFFVYKDRYSGAISVVYKRLEGDYGLIETEEK